METIWFDEDAGMWLFRHEGEVFILPSTWSGPIAFEGVDTDDWQVRTIEVGGLSWDLPQPMRVVNEDVGQHANAIAVGQILTMERGEGGALNATGTFDLGSAPAREAARQVATGNKVGVSIDPSPKVVELRMDPAVYAEMQELEAEFMEAMESGEFPAMPDPEKAEDGSVILERMQAGDIREIMVEANLRGATIVDIPAFPGAHIVAEMVAAPGAVVAAAAMKMIAAGGEEIDVTPPERAVENAQQALAWIEDGTVSEAESERVPERAMEIARLIAADDLTLEIVAEMSEAFAEVVEDWPLVAGFDEDDEGFPIAERVIWNAWGGTSAQEWAAVVHREAVNALSDVDNPPPAKESVAASAAMAAVDVHHTDVSDADWENQDHEVRLLLDEDPSYFAKAFVQVDDDKDGRSKEHWTGLHHEVDDEGNILAANVVACRIGVAVLNGKRGGFDVPPEDMAPMYAHFAAHIEDAGMEVEPPAFAMSGGPAEDCGCDGVALVATAGPRPPASAFRDPHLTGPSALTVTDDGLIYGHLASWGVCHIGLPGCVTPPRSETDYAYFMTGEVLTDEGAVATGRLTLGGGHADPTAGFIAAIEHYDNAGHAVADVAVGEDEFGIWIAGVVRPGTSDEQVYALRASDHSGDWRRVGGNLELVASLAVNVGGFPNPRYALAASGAQLSLTAAVGKPPRLSTAEQVARNIETQVASAMARIRRGEELQARQRAASLQSRMARAARLRERIGA